MKQIAETNVVKPSVAAEIERVMVGGDLSRLSEAQRVEYVATLCESVGLNPLTQPFQYINLSGKLRLYATKDATDQLRKLHGVSITNLEKTLHEGLYVVTASALDKTGRTDASTGAVGIANKKGDDLANAIMKAETKAKRRVTLSICGLGFLDESELDTVDTRPPLEVTPITPNAATPAQIGAAIAAATTAADVATGMRVPRLVQPTQADIPQVVIDQAGLQQAATAALAESIVPEPAPSAQPVYVMAVRPYRMGSKRQLAVAHVDLSDGRKDVFAKGEKMVTALEQFCQDQVPLDIVVETRTVEKTGQEITGIVDIRKFASVTQQLEQSVAAGKPAQAHQDDIPF